MPTSNIERELTPSLDATEVTFSPLNLFQELENMQQVMGADNPRLSRLSYEMSGTLAKLFTHKTPPLHTAEWMHGIEEKYSKRVIKSLVKYLDDVLAAARPLVHGIACGGSGYLCEIAVPESSTVSNTPSYSYTKRTDEFITDANRLTDVLSIADINPDEVGVSQLIQTTVGKETKMALKERQPKDQTAPQLFLDPHQISEQLNKSKNTTEKSKNDFTAWRRSLVDTLARIQFLLDAQNKSAVPMPPTRALGIAETSENEDIRAYIDTHLCPENIKGFLRSDLFNRGIRREIKACIPESDESKSTPAKVSAEGVVDRMIARHFSDAITTFFSIAVPHDPGVKELELQKICAFFAEYIVHFLDLLGGGVGRSIGRKINPLNESGEPLETLLDRKQDGPFDEKILPYVEVADDLIGTISIVYDLRTLFSGSYPMAPLSSLTGDVDFGTHQQETHVVLPLFGAHEQTAPPEVEAETSSLETRVQQLLGTNTLLDSPATGKLPDLRTEVRGPRIELTNDLQAHPVPRAVRIEDIAF